MITGTTNAINNGGSDAVAIASELAHRALDISVNHIETIGQLAIATLVKNSTKMPPLVALIIGQMVHGKVPVSLKSGWIKFYNAEKAQNINIIRQKW